jgi:acyl-CoA synthetase (NDP forming)
MRIVLADPAIDALLVIFTPPLVTRADDVARAICAVAADAGESPVVACFLGQSGVPDSLRGDETHRTVPSFAFPEAAARALGRAADHADWRRRPMGTVPKFDDIDLPRARQLVASVLRQSPEGTWLDAATAIELLSCFAIRVAPSRVVTDSDDACRAADELGYPVALKAAASDLVHKSDVGGVTLGLRDASQVRDAFAAMQTRLGARMGGALVQPMVTSGIETIVGATQDPVFGPLVLFGLGGTTAELLADRALRIVPVTDQDAYDLVRSLRGSPLFFGYRGAQPVDVAKVEELLLRVGRLADDLPELIEMDLNPVIVGEHDVVAVDVKIRLEAALARLPPDLRRMRV